MLLQDKLVQIIIGLLQIFQFRQDGRVDFYRSWAEFKNGFGELTGEHWLGNDNIHLLTKDNDSQVKYRLQSLDGNWTSADYLPFSIGDESQGYLLTTGAYLGAPIPGWNLPVYISGLIKCA